MSQRDKNPHGALTILCVEDEPNLRRDLVEELSEAGYTVLEAANGEEALMAITTLRPNLVLCDVNMPRLTGFDLLKRIRESDEELADVPFIFLTAYGERADLIHGRELGADDYMVKPVDFDLLLATVRARLESTARARRRVISRALSLEQQVSDLLLKGVSNASGLPDGDALRRLLCDPNLPDSLLVLTSIDGFHRLRPQYGGAATMRLVSDYIAHVSDSAAGRPTHLFQLADDVFAMLVEGAVAGEKSFGRIQRLIDVDLDLAGERVPLTSTLAISWIRRSEAHTPLAFLEDSLLALHFARREGGHTLIHIDIPASGRFRQMQFVEENFVEALKTGELFLAFQPKIDLATGRPVGAEALIRWQSAEQGLISPALFIPILERAGFAELVSDWVLDMAVSAVAQLRQDGIDTQIAVNASGTELHGRFIDRVEAALSRHQVQPAALEIEITETSVVHDMEFASEIGRRLRERGISVVVDDFGTGYSSLAYLRAFPLDGVKIDQSFVRGLPGNAADRQIVDSVIRLAKALNLKTVAEGVETQAQYDLLRHLGCDFAQGFLIARPLPLDGLTDFLLGRRN